MTILEAQAASAKAASRQLAVCGAAAKNRALDAIAKAISEDTAEILAANELDMQAGRANGMSVSLLDRLALTKERVTGIVDGIRQVMALEDPVGQVISMSTQPNGLTIGKRRTPLGVIAIIYEARPNVTVDAAVLCLKAGNAVILRGGKEAVNSNAAFVKSMRRAVKASGLDENCVNLVADTSRDSANELMSLSGYIDVLIPRGGMSLIKAVVENAKVPVIETGWGNCHIYIHEKADLKMGADIIFNAKTTRPSVCNAAETLLVDAAVAKDFLPMAKALLDTKNVELRCDEMAASILGSSVKPATEEDYYTEFGDYILAVKVVSGLEEAIGHINKYGSGHSEAIVTADYFAAQAFLDQADAAAVYVNASTRYTDGGEFGLGAEIGISTQKMHARGPMGLTELTSSKFIIYGSGQCR